MNIQNTENSVDIFTNQFINIIKKLEETENTLFYKGNLFSFFDIKKINESYNLFMENNKLDFYNSDKSNKIKNVQNFIIENEIQPIIESFLDKEKHNKLNLSQQLLLENTINTLNEIKPKLENKIVNKSINAERELSLNISFLTAKKSSDRKILVIKENGKIINPLNTKLIKKIIRSYNNYSIKERMSEKILREMVQKFDHFYVHLFKETNHLIDDNEVVGCIGAHDIKISYSGMKNIVDNILRDIDKKEINEFRNRMSKEENEFYTIVYVDFLYANINYTYKFNGDIRILDTISPPEILESLIKKLDSLQEIILINITNDFKHIEFFVEHENYIELHETRARTPIIKIIKFPDKDSYLLKRKISDAVRKKLQPLNESIESGYEDFTTQNKDMKLSIKNLKLNNGKYLTTNDVKLLKLFKPSENEIIQILKLYQNNFVKSNWTIKDIYKILKLRHFHYVLKTKKDDEIVGIINGKIVDPKDYKDIYPYFKNNKEINEIIIVSDLISEIKGGGTMLLDHVKKMNKPIFLTCIDKSTIGFYEKNGFELQEPLDKRDKRLIMIYKKS